MGIGIIWFKKDLRIQDHAPLHCASLSNLNLIPLYVVETDYWTQPYASKRQWHFIHDSLLELNLALKNLGQPLIIKVRKNAKDAIQAIHEQSPIETIYAHEETGNHWTYQRDLAVQHFCKAQKIQLLEYPTNGIVRKLKNRDHWQKIRQSRLATPLIETPKKIKPSSNQKSDTIPDKNSPLFKDSYMINVQKGGRIEAERILNSFLGFRAKEYLYHISKPQKSETHCSRLSPFLANGVISLKEVLTKTSSHLENLDPENKKAVARSLSAFKSRLSWRDHFIQKLEDQPEIEYQCMHPYFEKMRPKEIDEKKLEAWKNGMTGYPLIDACMRSLNSQGWVTFRMRAMLVSFASYHLWLDWRVTGKHLAAMFTDYEPGIHYSQLQMQSGTTGINAIRMYNPIKQSQEHDSDGKFIKKWVKELENIPTEYIHTPWLLPPLLQQELAFTLDKHYPKPIVDHETAIKHARSKISEIRKQFDFSNTAHSVFKKLGSRKTAAGRKKAKQTNKKDKNQLSLDFDED